jgi:hypothetical protein
MTREEAKEFIQDIANGMGSMTMEYWSEKTGDKLREALDVLEQGDVLDKIRAEIADLDDADYDYEGYYKAVTDALQIIDKYKAENKE